MMFRSPRWRRQQPLRKYTRFARSLRMMALPWFLLDRLSTRTDRVRESLSSILLRRRK